jgi:hypothetical protein
LTTETPRPHAATMLWGALINGALTSPDFKVDAPAAHTLI